MMFFDTQMHVIIFCITSFEVVMLFFQIIYYLERPTDKQRSRYLMLLVLLIAYNICSGGITPDQEVPIPMVVQNIVAYFLGFSVSMYAIYFYYKLFDLQHLRFLATYGLFLFLFMSFLVGFVAPYLATGDLELSRRITMVVPIVYGIVFVAKATRSLLIKIKLSKEQGDVITDTLYLAITAYFSMMCWATLPIINFFGDFQLVEHSVTNAGFLLMSIFYIRSATKEAKEERLRSSDAKHRALPIDKLNDEQLDALIKLAEAVIARSGNPSPDADETTTSYEESIKQYNLSRREIQLLPLLLKGYKNKAIADKLFISEGTVEKHVSNILSKTKTEGRLELISKLLSPSKLPPPGNDSDEA